MPGVLVCVGNRRGGLTAAFSKRGPIEFGPPGRSNDIRAGDPAIMAGLQLTFR